MPMSAGSSPVVAQETIRAIGSRPRAAAVSLRMSTSTAAPSLIPLALPGRDRTTVAGERGPKLGENLGSGIGAEALIVLNERVTFARRNGNGNDFLGEALCLLRGGGLAMRLSGEGILLSAGDVELARDILRGLAHVITVEGIPQAVAHQRVDESRIAEFGPGAHGGAMRRAAHAFLAAGDDDRGIAALQGLVREHDGAQNRNRKLGSH